MKLTLKTSFAELDVEFNREVTPFYRPNGEYMGPRQGIECEMVIVGTDKYYIGYSVHNPVDLYSEEIGEKKALADIINNGLSEEFNLTRSQRKEVWDQYFRERAAYKLDAAVAEYSKYFGQTAAPTPKEEPPAEAVDPNDPYLHHGGYKKAASTFLASECGKEWFLDGPLTLKGDFKKGESWINSCELSVITTTTDCLGDGTLGSKRIRITKTPF